MARTARHSVPAFVPAHPFDAPEPLGIICSACKTSREELPADPHFLSFGVCCEPLGLGNRRDAFRPRRRRFPLDRPADVEPSCLLCGLVASKCGCEPGGQFE